MSAPDSSTTTTTSSSSSSTTSTTPTTTSTASGAAAAATGGVTVPVRVVSYNVLSANLCTPKSYPRADPKAIQQKRRFKGVCEKLAAHMDKNGDGALICLQEISPR